jgi:hypothetical protein
MFFYYFIFLLIAFFIFISKSLKIPEKYLLIILAIILILIAGLRRPGIDSDYNTYLDIFNQFDSPLYYFKDYSVNSFFEPAYYLIPSIVIKGFGFSFLWVFLIFALIGISLKFIAISRLTDFATLSVLLYYCSYFILQDMTQIRAGVASAILLLCIPEIQKRNFIRFLLLITVGLLFHYSMIIFLPAYFLSASKINKKLYLGLLFVPIILYFLKFNIFSVLQLFKLGFISDKIEIYNSLLEADIFTGINVFNTIFLVQLISCTIFIIKSDLIIKNNKYAILLLKVYCIGAASFMLFSKIPVFAFRINELLGIVQIVLMPFMLYIIKPKYIAFTMVIIFALVTISNLLIHVGLLSPYFAAL